MTKSQISFEEVLAKIDEYRNRYRNTGMQKFDISRPYTLYPDNDSPEPKWPQPWPHCERAGVYLIFGMSMNLLYVGKASMGNAIGARLASYFGWDMERKGCRIKHENGWSEQPQFIISVAVPDETPFEAPALEEYLIRVFSDRIPDNTLGRLRNNIATGR